MGAVDAKHTAEHELTLEWDSTASNDMIADSILALITGIDKSPASVKLTSQKHSHTHHPHADSHEGDPSITRIQRIVWFLEAHFGDVELHMPEAGGEQEQGENNEPALIVRMDDSGETDAHINLVTLVVSCPSDTVRKRVEAVLDMAITTVSSLTDSFITGVSMTPEDADPKKEKSTLLDDAHGDTNAGETKISAPEADVVSS